MSTREQNSSDAYILIRWTLLKNVVKAVSCFRRSSGCGLRWDQNDEFLDNYHVRVELRNFLAEGLQTIRTRCIESRFGPQRGPRALDRYGRFHSMMQDILTLLTVMESRLADMAVNRTLYHIYNAFHRRPEFRRTLRFLTKCLQQTIAAACTFLGEENEMPSLKDAICVHGLTTAITEFSIVYDKTRTAIYYHPDQLNPQGQCVAMVPDALMCMNSFIFLLETASTRALRFYKAAERDTMETLYRDHEGDLNQLKKLKHPNSSVDCDVSIHITDSDDDIACGKLENHHPTAFPSSRSARSVNSGSSANNISTYLLHMNIFNWCDRTIWADLFPAQGALFDFVGMYRSGKIPPVVLARLKAASSVAVAMTIAALYGAQGHRPQAPLASFTIAYLGGSPTAGASVVICFNRAVGTVAACVLALIVAIIVKDWHPTSARVLQAFAVVLFQFPATYVRTYPLHGYAGSVAGFSAAILMLVPVISSEVAVARIVDTFVGVVIYLLIELAFNAKQTEDLLIDEMVKVFSSIEIRFSSFVEEFNFLCRTSMQSSSGADRASFTLDKSQLEKSNQMLASIDVGIRRQRDLMLFVNAEPALFRPPGFSDSTLHELLMQEQKVHHSIQVMSWAIGAAIAAYQPEDQASFMQSNYGAPPLHSGKLGRKKSSKHPKFLFLMAPLIIQMNKTISFVSLVTSYLVSTLEQLRSWRITAQDKNYTNPARFLRGHDFPPGGFDIHHFTSPLSGGSASATNTPKQLRRSFELWQRKSDTRHQRVEAAAGPAAGPADGLGVSYAKGSEKAENKKFKLLPSYPSLKWRGNVKEGEISNKAVSTEGPSIPFRSPVLTVKSLNDRIASLSMGQRDAHEVRELFQEFEYVVHQLQERAKQSKDSSVHYGSRNYMESNAENVNSRIGDNAEKMNLEEDSISTSPISSSLAVVTAQDRRHPATVAVAATAATAVAAISTQRPRCNSIASASAETAAWMSGSDDEGSSCWKIVDDSVFVPSEHKESSYEMVAGEKSSSNKQNMFDFLTEEGRREVPDGTMGRTHHADERKSEPDNAATIPSPQPTRRSRSLSHSRSGSGSGSMSSETLAVLAMQVPVLKQDVTAEALAQLLITQMLRTHASVGDDDGSRSYLQRPVIDGASRDEDRSEGMVGRAQSAVPLVPSLKRARSVEALMAMLETAELEVESTEAAAQLLLASLDRNGPQDSSKAQKIGATTGSPTNAAAAKQSTKALQLRQGYGDHLNKAEDNVDEERDSDNQSDDDNEDDHIAGILEVKVVNALLGSMKDLVAGMRALANTLGRMQSQREIRVTQNGWL